MLALIYFYGWYFDASLKPFRWLDRAIELDDSKRVRRILLFNDLNEYDIISGLCRAFREGNTETVGYLLENGAEPYENSYQDYLNECSQEIRTLLEEYYPSGN